MQTRVARRSFGLALAAVLACGVLAGCASTADSAGAGTSRTRESTPADTGQQASMQVVAYQGVTIDVPASWPVIDGAHAPACAAIFGNKPTVFVGQLIAAPSCPYFGDGGAPRADGVRLTPDGSEPADSQHVITSHGVTLLAERARPGAATDFFWISGVSIELGRGPDPGVERAIEDSVRLSPATKDSPVQGYCPRSGAPPMPTPERLAETTVLADGSVTLQPPRVTDVAVVSASRVWRLNGTPQPGATYRLLLARYSSQTPATINQHGSTTPLNSDRLAWVVYAQPSNTPLGNCGAYQISAYDAQTAESLGGAGYAPGP